MKMADLCDFLHCEVEGIGRLIKMYADSKISIEECQDGLHDCFLDAYNRGEITLERLNSLMKVSSEDWVIKGEIK